MAFKKCFIILLLGTGLLLVNVAEDNAKPAFNIDFNLGIGVDTFDNVIPEGEPITYQKLALSPDVSFGDFGIGLDLVFHYRFDMGQLVIRPEDWVPTNPTLPNITELYLAKFKYLRWAEKGAPLYVKFGSIDNGSLANGFLLGGYDNTLFLPDYRIFGLSFDLDFALFGFPLAGIETFVGNVVKWDVVGVRPFIRPLSILEIPILKDLELGITLAFDLNPFAFYTPEDKATFLVEQNLASGDVIPFFWGIDFFQPVLSNAVLSLAVMGDYASDQKNHVGGMLGVGGALFSFLSYGAQLRLIGEGFIPTYFDPYYDLIREYKYAMLESPVLTPAFAGWFASLGTSFLDGGIAINFTLDGPFGLVITDETGLNNPLNYPHLRGGFTIGEGIIPGLSVQANYDKVLIRDFTQIFNFDGAIISARINYQTGPAVLSFYYERKYNAESGWAATSDDVTSGFESLIKLN